MPVKVLFDRLNSSHRHLSPQTEWLMGFLCFLRRSRATLYFSYAALSCHQAIFQIELVVRVALWSSATTVVVHARSLRS
jgi:hypothetical protein